MRRERKAKILATLGPSSSDKATVKRLFEAGADVFRINMSHTDHDKLRRLTAIIREVEAKSGRPIGILADLQGPKLRVGVFAGREVTLNPGEAFVLDSDPTPGDKTRVELPHPEIFAALEPGHRLLLDDGKVRLRVTECDDTHAVTVIEVGTKLSDRKGVSVPDSLIAVDALTPKDRSDLEAALNAEVDWIALSFVQRAEDLAEVKKMARGRAGVMAKIEKPQAVERLAQIIEVADALMVARGDLGVELPLERVPGIQKQITRAARRAGKPVVVATQMLESMIAAPVPTRAEVSDVATAVFEGADAIMLSAEFGVRRLSGRGGGDHGPHRQRSGARPELQEHHARPADRARGDRRRCHLRRRAADRRDAQPRRHLLLHVIGGDRHAGGARAAADPDPGIFIDRRHGAAPVAGLGSALCGRAGAGSARGDDRSRLRGRARTGLRPPRPAHHRHRRRAARPPGRDQSPAHRPGELEKREFHAGADAAEASLPASRFPCRRRRP